VVKTYPWPLLILQDLGTAQASKCESRVRNAASRKHPADEFKEREVREWLKPFSEEEISVIRWLLHHGDADDNDFRALPMSVTVRGAALNRAIRCGLVKTFPKGTGTAHKIAEGYRDVLTDVLHPRPVDSPQS
jgi:hypothetical protein